MEKELNLCSYSYAKGHVLYPQELNELVLMFLNWGDIAR